RGGVAHFSNLSVHDQDSAALLRGNFDLTDQKVNLHGNLKTAASLTKTTHGIKAVFAKAIEPFFKKKPHKTVQPVHIGGTYSHPSFGLDLVSEFRFATPYRLSCNITAQSLRYHFLYRLARRNPCQSLQLPWYAS